MNFEQETRCMVTKIYLSTDEYKTLERANDIINKIWTKLDSADDVEGRANTVYNAIDTIGDSLETIMGNIYKE